MVKLSDEKKREIYKKEKKKIMKEKFDRMQERSTGLFGNILFLIYIFLSSLIISVGMAVYVALASGEILKEAFINNPYGVVADLMGTTLFT